MTTVTREINTMGAHWHVETFGTDNLLIDTAVFTKHSYAKSYARIWSKRGDVISYVCHFTCKVYAGN